MKRIMIGFYKRVIKDLQDGYLGKVTFDDIK